MRRKSSAATLACLVLLCLAAPVRAGEDPFADFRIPAHRTWSGSGSASMSAGRNLTGYSQYGSTRGDLSFGLARLWDSDALRYSWSVLGRGDFEYGNSSHRYIDLPWRDEVSLIHERGQVVSEEWRVDGSVRTYPWPVPVGLEAACALSGSYGQGWNQREHDDHRVWPVEWTHRNEYVRQLDHTYLNVEDYALTAGIGRVRDATVVYEVHVLEERLRQAGTLTRPLSRTARERIAAVLAMRGAFGTVHDRPTRFVWREVERMAREDGALADQGFDAYAAQRAVEGVSPRGLLQRERGWFVGPTLVGSHRHRVVRFDYHRRYYEELEDSVLVAYEDRFGRHGRSWSDDVQAGLRAEYHLPLGWAWQFDLLGTVRSPVGHDLSGHVSSVNARASWDVADRWRVSGEFEHLRSYLHDDGRNRTDTGTWAIRYGASLAYYLEDRTQIALSASDGQGRQRGDTIGIDRGFYRGSSFYLSVSHLFLGTVEAPGVIEPQRLAD